MCCGRHNEGHAKRGRWEQLGSFSAEFPLIGVVQGCLSMCANVAGVEGFAAGGLLGRWTDVVELGRVGQRPPDVTSARCSQLRQGRAALGE